MNTVAMISEDWLHQHATRDDASFGSLYAPAVGHLPLRALSVHAEIVGLVARTTLRQSFVNVHQVPLEATYIFPMPSRGAVTHFCLQVAGRTIEGVLKERGQARQDYEVAISTGYRAAIAEQERDDVFTMRVGNIAPGELATVELVLIAPLDVSGDEVTWRFPLVVAPQYIPGTPLPGGNVGDGTAHDTDAVPDASRISPPVLLPNYPNPVQLSITVDIAHDGVPLQQLSSSLHAIRTTSALGGIRVQLAQAERLNRDFILRYKLSAAQVGTMAYGCVDDKDPARGVFELDLIPDLTSLQARAARDVIFVLDRSGSMDGWKMVAARRAVARMVDALNPQDRFAVFAFSFGVETAPGLGEQLQLATDANRFKAVEFLANMDARGGTEMAHPLGLACDLLNAPSAHKRERILVLVTDGQVGNEEQILRSLSPKLSNLRVFTIGIDRAVNEGFLRRMAALGRGECELVESEARLDEVLNQLHRRIDVPVLTNLRLSLEGAQLLPESIAPAHELTLFAGSPLTVRGRYQAAQERPVFIINGEDAAGHTFTQRVPMQLGPHSAIGALWAKARIRDLEDQYTLRRGSPSMTEAQILETSLRYGVLCRFTAFVAVDKAERIIPSGPLHQVTQAVEAVEGWAAAEPAPTRSAAFPFPGSPVPAAAAAPAPLAASFAPMSPRESYDKGNASPVLGAAMDSMSFSEAEEEKVAVKRRHKKESKPTPPAPGQSMTRAGSIDAGALRYLSPELVKGLTPTPASDQFILAIIFFECLTGRRLFARSSDFDALVAIRDASLPSPLFNATDYALQRFDAILRRALSEQPDARYHELNALMEALRQQLGAVDAKAVLAPLVGAGEQTLEQLLQSGRRLSPEQACALILEVASQLQSLHDQTQQAYGKLSPALISLSADGQVHLMIAAAPTAQTQAPGLLERLSDRLFGARKDDRRSFWK